MEYSLVANYVNTVLILECCSVLEASELLRSPCRKREGNTIEQELEGLVPVLFRLVLVSDGLLIVSKQHIHVVNKHVCKGSENQKN